MLQNLKKIRPGILLGLLIGSLMVFGAYSKIVHSAYLVQNEGFRSQTCTANTNPTTASGKIETASSSVSLSINQPQSRTGLSSCLHELVILNDGVSWNTHATATLTYTVPVMTMASCNIRLGAYNQFTGSQSYSHTSATTTPITRTINLTNGGYSTYQGFTLRQAYVNSTTGDCTVSVSSLTIDGVEYINIFDTNATTTVEGDTSVIIVDEAGSMTTEWECTTVDDTTNCLALATSASNFYDGPNLQEWLLVAMVIVFLLSFAFWPRISISNIKGLWS